MRLALAQIASGDDVAGNLRAVGDAVARAADRGAELVLLPEYAMYEKKMVDATFAGVAEPLDGRFGSAVAELAATYGVTVVVGVVERSDDDADPRPFNTLAAFGADGGLLAQYWSGQGYNYAMVSRDDGVDPQVAAQARQQSI